MQAKLRVISPERKKPASSMHFIAIGSNLPWRGLAPLQLCVAALHEITRVPGVKAAVRAPWYETAPVPPSPQPRYINGMVRLALDIKPAALLAALQAIERAFGRVRGESNAARTLDIDIIDSAGLVRSAPDPVLPHPRAHQRAFVLRPLRDLAPDWVHPTLGTPVESLLAALPPAEIRLARPPPMSADR